MSEIHVYDNDIGHLGEIFDRLRLASAGRSSGRPPKVQVEGATQGEVAAVSEGGDDEAG